MHTARARVRQLLVDRGAQTVAHPGGTLLAHLERVALRLSKLGTDQTVQLAGLAHAVYGTDGFDTPLLSLDERAVLAAAGGLGVEQLVYLYGACDRTLSWPALAQTGQVHDRWTGRIVTLSGVELARFIDLSTVNELDVLEHVPEVRARSGHRLLAAFQAWEGAGSPAVTAHAVRVRTNEPVLRLAGGSSRSEL